ncbi:heavy metal transport/detoxification protein [Acrocarpospora corrugata]|uniref:Heavy metal transport/detoxification protein n=1 Tax=Acrocarpospora corrugata TaxID=35763 RepID=A0A5M3VZ33_9ACTN|nr:heavy metal-associated domain-containing protein [Acrocarpospora corrugata]GES01349.1 heavy metal transport/detoxification protein [Acrocarpospora corrugata]
MTSASYVVAGMVCANCVTWITEELAQLPGVTAVSIDLPTDTVTVTSDHLLDIADIRRAVEEAGYTLVSS